MRTLEPHAFLYCFSEDKTIKPATFHFLLQEFHSVLFNIVKNVEPITPISEVEKLCPIFSGLYNHMKTLVDQISNLRTELDEENDMDDNSVSNIIIKKYL